MITERIATVGSPIATSTLLIASLVLSYLISHFYHYNNSDLPFISDTAGKPPPSCWFALTLTATAYSFLFTSFIKYYQTRLHMSHESTKIRALNVGALIVSALSALGLCLIAHFPVTTVKWVHDLGAFLAFGFGNVYEILQTILTAFLLFKFPKVSFLKFMLIFRSFLSFISLVSTILHVVMLFKGNYTTFYNVDSKTDLERRNFYICTGSEWVAAFVIAVYVSTLVYEISAVKVQIKVKRLTNKVTRHKQIGQETTADASGVEELQQVELTSSRLADN